MSTTLCALDIPGPLSADEQKQEPFLELELEAGAGSSEPWRVAT